MLQVLAKHRSTLEETLCGRFLEFHVHHLADFGQSALGHFARLGDAFSQDLADQFLVFGEFAAPLA